MSTNISPTLISLVSCWLVLLTTVDLQDNLNLESKPEKPDSGAPTVSPVRQQMTGLSPRPENMRPRPFGGAPPPKQRPSTSEEERRRLEGKPRPPPGESDVFADPPHVGKLRDSRPRRNSETTAQEKQAKPADGEEDKRRRDRRHRERRRYGKPALANQRLDIIDKLDVTSIYGTGCKSGQFFLRPKTMPSNRLSIPPRWSI